MVDRHLLCAQVKRERQERQSAAEKPVEALRTQVDEIGWRGDRESLVVDFFWPENCNNNVEWFQP